MKDKSWIIIVIMGIALTISLGYSIVISQKNANIGESTVTTTSIIEMTATTVTIKNTLTGTGTVELKEQKDLGEISDGNEIESSNDIAQSDNNNISKNTTISDSSQEDKIKTYQITLSIEDKDLKKAKVGQEVEIAIKKDEEILNYIGKVIKINESNNNKSTLNIQISNPDENIETNMSANCTVIIEKAENVVGLPAQAIQKDDNENKFVDVVQEDGTTNHVNIKTGISDDYYVEVTYGLNVGDRVQIVKSTTTVVDKKDSNMITEK